MTDRSEGVRTSMRKAPGEGTDRELTVKMKDTNKDTNNHEIKCCYKIIMGM